MGTATRPQVKAIASAAMVAAGFRARGSTINGVAVDMVHTHNDILIDALYNVIERFAYDDFHDPSSGLPSSPSVGDSYISTATANGWTDDYIYTWDGTQWVEQIPEHGWLVWVEGAADFYKYTANGWETLTTVGTHYHTYLVKSGDTTPEWYVDTDGGLACAGNWKFLPDGNYLHTQKWTGSAWVTVKSTKYVA